LEGQDAICVADDLQAWHAGDDDPALDLNPYYLGVELAEPTIGDAYSNWQVAKLLAVLIYWARKYGGTPQTFEILKHSDTAQGQAWGKSDPGPLLPWDFIVEETWANV
jgi:N-acetyl-anhydromuramyl-L-alanine amidase AmpD